MNSETLGQNGTATNKNCTLQLITINSRCRPSTAIMVIVRHTRTLLIVRDIKMTQLQDCMSVTIRDPEVMSSFTYISWQQYSCFIVWCWRNDCGWYKKFGEAFPLRKCFVFIMTVMMVRKLNNSKVWVCTCFWSCHACGH